MPDHALPWIKKRIYYFHYKIYSSVFFLFGYYLLPIESCDVLQNYHVFHLFGKLLWISIFYPFMKRSELIIMQLTIREYLSHQWLLYSINSMTFFFSLWPHVLKMPSCKSFINDGDIYIFFFFVLGIFVKRASKCYCSNEFISF